MMGELAGRFISFIMSRYLNQTTVPTDVERLDSLHRLLQRVRVIVEEAEQRRVASRAMLLELSVLKEEMYRGCYTLDMFSCREVSHSFAISRFHPAKRVRLHGGGGDQSEIALRRVIGSLKTVIADAKVFIEFLIGCPRLFRQPYSMYMFFDKCMFGRQMEMEHIITFLLRPEGQGSRSPGVLPVVGSRRVGKSTLIEHVCNDERVRNHFSQIVSITPSDLEGANSRSSSVIKHRNNAIIEERVMVIVELGMANNISEGLDGTTIQGLLGRLYFDYESRISHVSKIILTSRSYKIASFGTTQPLILESLSQEAYWYFFKARAFGSANAAEHPKLVSIAMDMAMEMEGCFVIGNIFSRVLRSNLDVHSWSLALATLRKLKQKTLLMHEGCQTETFEVNKTSKVNEYLVFHDEYQSSFAHGEVPKIHLQDVIFGGARPRGKFDALAWKSSIPPYFNYVYSCEIRSLPRHMIARKKFRKIGSS